MIIDLILKNFFIKLKRALTANVRAKILRFRTALQQKNPAKNSLHLQPILTRQFSKKSSIDHKIYFFSTTFRNQENFQTSSLKQLSGILEDFERVREGMDFQRIHSTGPG